MSLPLQIVLCLLAMAVVIFLCYKGVPPIIVAPISIVLVCLATGMDALEGVLTTFPSGVGTMITSLLLIFVSSSLMAAVMDKSRCAVSVANFLAKLLGPEMAPVCILLICGVLTLCGLSMGAIIIAATIGDVLCERANYSRNIILGCIYGGVVMAVMPYAPTANNFLAAGYLGTSASSGALVGFINLFLVIGLDAVYATLVARKWRKQGKGFVAYKGYVAADIDAECPNVVVAIIPLIVVILIYNLLNWDLSLCMLVGSLLTVTLNFKAFKAAKWYEICRDGVMNGIMPAMNMALMSALGLLLTQTPVFAALTGFLQNANMNPYIVAIIACMVVAFFIGAVVSTLNIVGSTLGPLLVSLCEAGGYSVGNLHRIMLFGTNLLGSMPYNGGLISICDMFKLKLKDCYGMVFMMATIIPILVLLLISVPLASILPG